MRLTNKELIMLHLLEFSLLQKHRDEDGMPPGPTLHREVAVRRGCRPVVAEGRGASWSTSAASFGSVSRPMKASSTSAVHVIDAGGSTIGTGMVDAHGHVTLPGGSHWICRASIRPKTSLMERAPGRSGHA